LLTDTKGKTRRIGNLSTRNVKRLENEDNSHEGHEISAATVDESAPN
jgi:hypothetical protein